MNLSDEEKLKRWNSRFKFIRALHKNGDMNLWGFRNACRAIGLTDDEITDEITLIEQELENERTTSE